MNEVQARQVILGTITKKMSFEMKDPASSVIFIDERIFYFVCDGLSQDIRFDDPRIVLMLYAFYAWLEWEKPLKCKRSAKNQFSQSATNVDVHNCKLYHCEKDLVQKAKLKCL